MAQLGAGGSQAEHERQQMLERMMRYRDGRGIYADGGCIDATREHPRWMCPGTSTLELPAASAAVAVASELTASSNLSLPGQPHSVITPASALPA